MAPQAGGPPLPGCTILVTECANRSGGKAWPSCSAAGSESVRAPRLLLDPDGDRRIVILYPGKQLQAHHRWGTRFDFQLALARVEAYPEPPRALELRNLSSVTWTARLIFLDATSTGAR